MTKIRKSAKGENCQVRIPGICCHNPDTVILAHISGGGMGIKQPDTEAAYCCNTCHDELDGRTRRSSYHKDELLLMHHEGAMRTRRILINKRLIGLK